MTYELEILECKHNFEDLQAPGKKFFIPKTGGNVIHSALPNFSGDNTHEADGKLKRKGGGQPVDYFGEAQDQIDQANNKVKVVEKSIE